MVKVAQGLSELTTKLENAGSSLSPWADVSDTKQYVAGLQNSIDGQIVDAQQKADSMEEQQANNGLLSSHELHTMQEGYVKNQQQRRRSLTEVSQTLSEISYKLDTAEASW